jgi:pyridoxine 5-phosphate synthase
LAKKYIMAIVKPIYLGVNIDHVATLRQARGVSYPEPLQAALIAEQAGADGITMHLREDRRHILDRDVELAQQMLHTKLNLEMAATPEMIAIACALRPADCCLVPERREELTTEGGLDVASNIPYFAKVVTQLHEAGIRVSPFIDPDPHQLEAVAKSGAKLCELHTGAYAEAKTPTEQTRELERIIQAVQAGKALGLTLNAGHGLHYHNTAAVARIPDIHELNIGHAIIARAVLTGLAEAVREMKNIMRNARMQAII